MTQLAAFQRGVDQVWTLTAEFVGLALMKDTMTADDIFASHDVGCLDRLGRDWTHAVSIATDGVLSILGRQAEVFAKLKEKDRQ